MNRTASTRGYLLLLTGRRNQFDANGVERGAHVFPVRDADRLWTCLEASRRSQCFRSGILVRYRSPAASFAHHSEKYGSRSRGARGTKGKAARYLMQMRSRVPVVRGDRREETRRLVVDGTPAGGGGTHEDK